MLGANSSISGLPHNEQRSVSQLLSCQIILLDVVAGEDPVRDVVGLVFLVPSKEVGTVPVAFISYPEFQRQEKSGPLYGLRADFCNFASCEAPCVPEAFVSPPWNRSFLCRPIHATDLPSQETE